MTGRPAAEDGGTIVDADAPEAPVTDPLRHKFLLDEDEMPTRWYNIVADLPTPPPPPLHPGTGQPVGPDDLAPLFPMDLILQEVSTERYIDIPEEVHEVYRLWRPVAAVPGAPPGEGARHPGADLLQVRRRLPGRLAQAEHRGAAGLLQRQGRRQKLTTETGAGQWGTALAFACAQFGLECEVWQVRASYDQKPYRRMMMETFGGTVHPQPLGADRGRPGDPRRATPTPPARSGIAITEAVEVAAQDPTTKYALGRVLNHVLLHQTIIGEEALLQLAKAGETPDLIVGCTGGGSNFGGLVFPFLREKLARAGWPRRSGAVEPAACPSLTQGTYAYDFGDTAGLTPLMKMHTLGPRLRARPDPRRRAALPRDEPADQPPLRAAA